jgi:hypothetical protein
VNGTRLSCHQAPEDISDLIGVRVPVVGGSLGEAISPSLAAWAMTLLPNTTLIAHAGLRLRVLDQSRFEETGPSYFATGTRGQFKAAPQLAAIIIPCTLTTKEQIADYLKDMSQRDPHLRPTIRGSSLRASPIRKSVGVRTSTNGSFPSLWIRRRVKQPSKLSCGTLPIACGSRRRACRISIRRR